MVESEIMKQCGAAFPGIEAGDHRYTAEKLLADMQTDLAPKQTDLYSRQLDRTNAAQFSAHPSADTLLGHAASAKYCSDFFKASDLVKQMELAREKSDREAQAQKEKIAEEVKDLLGTTELTLAKNVLEGKHDWIPVLKLEEPGHSYEQGLSDNHLSSIDKVPPEQISAKEQALYSALSRSGSMEAAVMRDAHEENSYWLVAGKYGDHGFQSQVPRPIPPNIREAFHPRIVN